MVTETIVLEPRRELGQGCCSPAVAPRLDDHRAVEAAALFKAFSDPARLQILDVLAQHTGQVCVCDLEGVVGLPDPQTGRRPRQSTISHHLKVLRDAGLVGYTKQGQWAYYYLHRDQLEAAQAMLARLR